MGWAWSPGPLTGRMVEAVDDLARVASSDDPSAERLAEVRDALGEPLRVAVAGRIKAGKSTLVNALLGQRAAATDVGECTRVVSWFRFGTPECVDVHDRQGGVTRLSLQRDGSLPTHLGVALDDVHHLDVWLSNDELRGLTIIDTPGLASANEEVSQRTHQLLALDEASRGAVAQADVLLLVLALDATRDDEATLTAFADQFGGLRTSSMNTITVLTRIDQLAEPGLDPVAAAGATARRCAEQLELGSAAVLPVVGLLAEATQCGVLTEADVAVLGALADLGSRDPQVLERALVSTRRFVRADLPGSVAERQRLLEILDLYGIETAIEAIRAGSATSTALVAHLRSRSGIDALRDRVWGQLAPRSDALKAAWAMGALQRIAADPALAPAAAVDVRDRLERLWLDPAMGAVVLLRALEAVGTGEVDLPVTLQTDLRDLAWRDLGAIDGPSAAEGASRWRAYANSGRTSPAQRDVAENVCRVYELAWERAESGR